MKISLYLLHQKEENDAITYCARGGTTCKSSRHLAGRSLPRCRPPSPSPDSGSPEAFYYIRLWGWKRHFQKYLNCFALSPAFLLRDTLSTTGWTYRHLRRKTCKSRTFSVFFQRTAMSMGATMAARVEAIGHTLPQVQALPRPLLALFGKCINKTHPGLSLLVLWVSRLVWIVGYWGRDTLTEHINYSSGLPGPSEEKRKGKQHCNMNGYEGGRYLYYRKYSVQSACPCLLLPEVGSSRSSLKDPK